ncbi:hypothetical protein COC42_05735 [Sphingomonas spermidinifaciens]|uniref:Uncharacterized protein n=1 Tax=Sphingomonas spermidinifaciens TaxID=1141889 RepID=A0A2A4B700_9SPHN|nr:hypothetical protein COC42_05735 [Sphingomonas spermidinifaciens]
MLISLAASRTELKLVQTRVEDGETLHSLAVACLPERHDPLGDPCLGALAMKPLDRERLGSSFLVLGHRHGPATYAG